MSATTINTYEDYLKLHPITWVSELPLADGSTCTIGNNEYILGNSLEPVLSEMQRYFTTNQDLVKFLRTCLEVIKEMDGTY